MLGDLDFGGEFFELLARAVLVVATTEGAMVVYESDSPEYVEAFAIPLRCAE